jgi:hypothetical protein
MRRVVSEQPYLDVGVDGLTRESRSLEIAAAEAVLGQDRRTAMATVDNFHVANK